MVRSIKNIKKDSPRNYSIIEFQHPMDRKILLKAKHFPTLGEVIEGCWNVHIYREFDETNDNHLFCDKKINDHYFPLYKGGSIYQYEYNFNPERSSRYVDKNSPKVKKKGGFAFKNKCYKDYRLVIRGISGKTNERSLVVAIIPKNSFITNSLNGIDIVLPSEFKIYKNQYSLLVQSLLNSFVVDYFIRQKISSAINKKFLLPLHIPRIDLENPFAQTLIRNSALLTCIGRPFNRLADEIGIPRGGVDDQEKRWKIQGEIDGMVAHIYGLERKEFEHILSTFKTGSNKERQECLKRFAMESFEKNQMTRLKKTA